MPARDLVVVGASADGIEALKRLVGALPADLTAGVCVIQAPLPGVVVDAQDQIVYLGAGVEPWLRVQSGPPSYHLPDVIAPELREALRTTVARARARRRAAESLPLPVTVAGAPQLVALVAQPLARGEAGELMVLFDSAEGAPPALTIFAGQPDEELPGVLATLQAEHDVVYEELRVANEELRVINEELLASTEELESRREELQSVNDQLQKVNGEQQQTLAALARANADLENLIAATAIGTLYLDRDLRVRRYTEPARQIVHLLPSDLGRPLAHLTHELRYAGLLEDAARVLASLAPAEREVPHADGRWFLVRIRPYFTAEHQVTGVALIFLDISARKGAEEALRQSHDELERRVRERTAELVKAHAARQALLRELVQAQEAERLRIARELHDTLGQQITAILLGLQAIRERSHGREAALHQLDQIWAIVQAMGREMHEIAVNLRPTALDDVGLADALRSYVEGWSRRSGIETKLFVTGVEGKALPPEIESTLYRVAQEGLTNVVRHAEASRVSVVLEGDRGRVVAIVEDDGRGFDVEATLRAPQQSGHLGLLGMEERVALVGGTLTIESEPGAGTTLIARIPLPA